MPQSPNLNLPFLQPAQAQKHVTHNEALTLLDAVVQLSVQSIGATVPPAQPVEGERHIVGAAATLDWAGQDNAVAVWANGGWLFGFPATGWIAFDQTSLTPRVFNGTSWQALSVEMQNLPGLGIGASFDAVNPLTVSGAASLFNHAGAGHQLKMNMADSAQTAAVLYQSNWSGRAEAGLLGNENYAIKVSADGSSFTEALRIDAATGHTSIKSMNSGRIVIADDTAALVTPPSAGGIVHIMLTGPGAPQIEHSAIASYNVTGTPDIAMLTAGAEVDNMGAQVLTGTDATDGHTGLSVQSNQLYIENRSGTEASYSFSFLC